MMAEIAVILRTNAVTRPLKNESLISRVGVIPATADQVMIGDLTRSRLESVKVLFFAGLNEGLVPQRKSGGSLLTDTDREIFRSFDMELAPTAREDSCIQKFYLYLMMCKPSRKLILN